MVCSACRARPVPPDRRKYCNECGARASALWKRHQRRAWRESGQKYWLDNWKHKPTEERRAYYRRYMRLYREKLRKLKHRNRKFVSPSRTVESNSRVVLSTKH